MDQRLKLHEELSAIIGSDHVYYQPPESMKLNYPCMVYKLNRFNVRHADDLKYIKKREYTVTLIDRDPDSKYVESLESEPRTSFERFYTANNLNHWVFIVH